MTPFLEDPDFTLYLGDALDVLRELPDESVHCCVTSPPYWGLRDYGMNGQLGLEPTPAEYASRMTAVFAEVRRVLRSDGTCWLNVGDSYNSNPSWGRGHSTLEGRPQDQIPGKPSGGWLSHAKTDTLKTKDLVGIPWRLAFALQADGWYLRSDIIWSKTNPMPESVIDRPTKAHEYVFLLTKSARYFYDYCAIREPATWDRWSTKQTTPKHTANENDRYASMGREWTEDELDRYREGGRNARTVWEIPTKPYAEAHFAVFPEALVEPCIKAGCPTDGIVLDPFMGSGTTALVARRLGRRSIGIELNPEYAALAAKRLSQLSLLAQDAA